MNEQLPGEQDAEIDARLRAEAGRIRSEASEVGGAEVVVTHLRSSLRSSRRRTWIAVGVAAALLAATVGFALDRDTGAEFAAGGGGSDADLEVAREIVAGLPEAPIDPHEVVLVASTRTFDSCEALVEDLRRVGAAHVGSRGFGEQSFMVTADGALGNARELPAGERTAGPEMAAAAADSGAGGETLGTNVIVAGVDEPDTVKATGSLVVEIVAGKLRVIDTAAGAIVGELPLADTTEPDGQPRTSAYPSTLIVDGSRAVVFGSEIVEPIELEGDPSAARPPTEYLAVTFVDLADPSAPEVTERVRIEGSLVAARRVEDRVRIVIGSSMQDLPIVIPTTASAVAPALEQNRLAVASSTADDWIPEWDRGQGTEAERLVDCDRVVVPDTFAGVQMTSLVDFSLAGPFEPSSTGLLAPSEDITASATDVVVASHVWVDPAERSEDFSDWATALHRFSFGEDGPAYVGSGAVEGSIRDDFSLGVLDEDTIGVVTVDVLPWQERENAEVTVRTLGSANGSSELTEIGSLVPEGSGSSAAAMRFVGDRLLVSSGFLGDRLSVVDLSDPAAPADAGGLTLVGGGRYLHPLEGDRVLVVGDVADPPPPDTTVPTSPELHLSVLDLTGEPTELARWVVPDASSDVLYDHHAFTWWPQRNTAAMGITYQPVTFEAPSAPEALLLDVEAGTPPRTVRPAEAQLGRLCPPEQLDREGCDDSGWPYVRRVLVVDGALWVYTSESLERIDPDTLASQAVVALPDPSAG